MKIPFLLKLSILASLILSLGACSEKEEVFETDEISDFALLTPGKYITYRLDSTIAPGFGYSLVKHSYQVKHVADALIEDNLGRPSVRVLRFIRAADGSGEWEANGSYMITKADKQIEVIEDNLRFIKLHAPMRQGFSWRGNSHLTLDPYAAFGHNIDIGNYMKNWEYYYMSFDESLNINGETYTDVYSVEEENFEDNWPAIPGVSGFSLVSHEKYARNIGLVYRVQNILEFDPNTSGQQGVYNGFGVEMWMIDHN